MSDLISRQAALRRLEAYRDEDIIDIEEVISSIGHLPAARPEIIRCKDCKYGEQDEVGRWFCRSLGCQIGSEDGSGFCADAERKDDE